MKKLEILTDAAKYDVACTSSGSQRSGDGTGIGNAVKAGICHSFSSDGRCISLLKILLTNECIYDCKYCANRSSNDVPRAAFTPDEICRLTIEFYRRNYIEGLFLSSGVWRDPTFTMGMIYRTVLRLRRDYRFQGYIHIKAIPGADPEVVRLAGFLVDRMSVNLELPTAEGLSRLAPNKHRKAILTPMRQIQNGIAASREEVALYGHAPSFVPAGQSTQMIIGATPESDYQILSVAESLYRKFDLKRVFYSAFVRVNEDRELPALPGGPPLLREHRLYQADWLLRFYGFSAGETIERKATGFQHPAGSEGGLGPPASGGISDRGQQGSLRAPVAGTRNRSEERQEDRTVQAKLRSEFRASQEDGDRPETGAVLHYLQRQDAVSGAAGRGLSGQAADRFPGKAAL